MKTKLVSLLKCLLLQKAFHLLLLASLLNGATYAQQTAAPTKIDSIKESHVRLFKMVGVTDTAHALVRVLVKETGTPGETIQGATVLLRRDQDKMLGRVTKQDGRCNFMPSAAEYFIRVQLTGYKSLEVGGYQFEKGKVYEMELRMARSQ
jgi:hypothetical protein